MNILKQIQKNQQLSKMLSRAKSITSAIPKVEDQTLQTWIKSIDTAVREVAKKSVTKADLVDIGLASLNNGNLESIIPKKPEFSPTVPEKVLNLTANGAYSSSTLTWITPVSKVFGSNVVYRSEKNDFGTAVQVGSTLGDVYTDYVGNGVKAYYWVRTVSKYGVEGELSLSAYTTTSIDINYILDQLKDKITNNQFTTSLKEEIAKITSIETDLDKVNSFVINNTTHYAGSEEEFAGTTEIYVGHISEETLRIEGDQANVKQLEEFSLSYEKNDLAVKALIQNEKVARVSAQEAMAGTLDTLIVTVNNDITAAIRDEATVRANQNSALSEKITTVQATVGENTSSIEQSMTAINGINAEWKIKVQAGGAVSGVSLGISGGESEFTVLTNRFSVVSPNGLIAVPFVIDSDGRTVINTAIIKDASIDSAKIKDLSADKITAGDISADRMKANIVQAVEGKFESLSAITATIGHLRTKTTGARTEIRDNLIEVFDQNDQLRVQIGEWLE